MKDIALDFDTLKETYDVECKAAQGRDGLGELPKDFWESYSALANTDGGSIFLGVVEKDYTFTPLGIQDSDKVIKDLVAIANNREKVSVNLLGNADIVSHSFGAKNVIEIKVRRATRKERPFYLKKTPMGNSFRRRHDADQRMSGDEVKRMLVD